MSTRILPENSKSMAPSRFWQEVFIAAVRAGMGARDAQIIAQQALDEFTKLMSTAPGS